MHLVPALSLVNNNVSRPCGGTGGLSRGMLGIPGTERISPTLAAILKVVDTSSPPKQTFSNETFHRQSFCSQVWNDAPWNCD